MTEEQTFVTLIKNERKTGVILRDQTGMSLNILAPGRDITLESWHRETIYAPFSKIIYQEKDLVEVTPNTSFPAPKSKWILTAINIDGREMERRIIGGREVVLMKGLPRVFELEIDDPLATYSKLEIREVVERLPSDDWPEYNSFKTVLKDIFFDRDESELAELVAELEKIAAETSI